MRHYSSFNLVIKSCLPESRKNGGLGYESNSEKKNRSDIFVFSSYIIGALDIITDYLDVHIQHYHRK